MRRLIVNVLDLVCILLVIASTLAGVFAGLAQGGAMAVVVPLAAFVGSCLIAGSVLAITEIAKNTRKMIALLERTQASPTVADASVRTSIR